MRPPCETVVKEFLPVIRAIVASELHARGQSQAQIADLLSLTQPAVSGYLNSSRNLISNRFNTNEIRDFSKSLASSLTGGKISESEAVKGICHLCTNLKCQGAICALHKERVSALRQESCDSCIQLYSKGISVADAKYAVLEDVRTAIGIIQASKDFTTIMPEVHVNIVAATEGAKDTYDIAGVPGRITKVEGWARAFMPPEFGSSTHMAKVLLAAMHINPRLKATVNIAHDTNIEKAVNLLDLRSHKFNRTRLPAEFIKGEEAVICVIRRLSEEGKDMPNVIIDEGGYWIEPASYIFGSSATQVATLAVKIAETVTNLKK